MRPAPGGLAAAAADAGATVPTCDPMGLPVARYREIMDELGIESVAEGIDVVVATLPPAVDGQVCGIYFTIDRWCRLHNDVPASDGPVIEAGQEAFVSLLWLPDLPEPDAATEQEIVIAVGNVLGLASTAELMWCRGVGWVQSPFESQSPALLVVIVRGDSGHPSVWALQSEAPRDSPPPLRLQHQGPDQPALGRQEALAEILAKHPRRACHGIRAPRRPLSSGEGRRVART